MAQQYETSTITSPTLEALYHDLDLFINELSVNPTTADSTTKYSNSNNDITPLELNKPLYQEEEPVLDDYITTPPPPQPPIHKSNSISSVSSTNSVKVIQTPPMSPSALRIASATDYFPPKEDYVPTTRSSSLSRSKSAVHFAPVPHNLPTSPLAFEIVHEGDDFPNHAFLSYMTQQVILQVSKLNEHRRIYCSAEYPLSFTGEEIMDIIRTFSPPGLTESIYLEIAQCFLNCTPKLIKPIDSSEKSLRRNKIYDSPTEMYTLIEESLDEDIQGIYTPLTRCYSLSCLPGHPGCYSPSCPNKIYALNGAIFKSPASKSLMSSSSHDTTLSRAWSATVAKDILKSMPEGEIKRQEAIHEVIYTEDDYVRDLKILDLDFAKELLSSQCIEEERKQEFHDKIVNNYQEILEIHNALYQDLRDHQAICQATSGIGLVDQIGDIFLRHVPKFKDAYLRYGPHVVLAEYEAKIESERNMLFKHFIKAREQLPQCRRLPFRHFIILPVTRLQRYSLLLGAIHKKTPDDHPDKQWIGTCIEEIKDVAEQVDAATSLTKNTLRIWEINDRIRYKADEYHNLDLMNPNRRLLKEGTMSRKSHMNVETIELQVFVFDHLLLMTKPKKSATKADDIEYHVSKRPIPMQLLQVQDASEGSAWRTMTREYMPSPNNAPLVISHLGRNGQDFMLYPESPSARAEWKEKIVQAKEMFDAVSQKVFDFKTLSDTKFANPGSSSPNNHGKVTCTVPFRGPGGVRMIVIGTQQGVWIGVEGNSHSIQLVLTMADIQQMQVLQDHFILLILADKTLWAYALEPLLSPQSLAVKKGVADRQFQKITQSITYFHAGQCSGRTIVIAMKKKGVDSNFKVFEPVCGDLRETKNKQKYFSKSGLFSKTTPWFRSSLEFYIGTESYAMHFLKARVVVVCARGFEIINLEALNMNRNLPDMNNPDFGFVQQRSDLRPLGMFRCKENYLLCYDAFAFMVNVHGAFVRDAPLIEWEGVPQSVAFWFPYVVGFDARFIEVRHIETGELIQILPGTNMRCLQYTSTTAVPEIHGCMSHPFKPDFQLLFQLLTC